MIEIVVRDEYNTNFYSIFIEIDGITFKNKEEKISLMNLQQFFKFVDKFFKEEENAKNIEYKKQLEEHYGK